MMLLSFLVNKSGGHILNMGKMGAVSTKRADEKKKVQLWTKKAQKQKLLELFPIM